MKKYKNNTEGNKMKYDLYLKSLYYGETLIKTNCAIKNVQKEIDKWCKDNNFKSYYTRVWTDQDENIIYDFGSHHIFFVLKPKEEENENVRNK